MQAVHYFPHREQFEKFEKYPVMQSQTGGLALLIEQFRQFIELLTQELQIGSHWLQNKV